MKSSWCWHKKLCEHCCIKHKLLATIRPIGKSILKINDTEGVRCLTNLRLNISALNGDGLRRKFDCPSPIGNCGTGNEDNEQFLLHYQQFDLMHADFVGNLSKVPPLDINDMNTKVFCNLNSYGSPHLNIITYKMIRDATIWYIKATQRFQWISKINWRSPPFPLLYFIYL